MQWKPSEILAVLDACCDDFTFPMLDNGYVYLAATRMSGYRSDEDWALVIEVFGFSPRAGLPDIGVHTFASTLGSQRTRDSFVNESAYATYLNRHPHDELEFVHPIDEGDWIDREDEELLSEGAQMVRVRGEQLATPALEAYTAEGIALQAFPRVAVFEFCRWLAASRRESVLCTEQERRLCVLPGMRQVFQLEAWRHPDLAHDERPSSSPTFQAIAEALANGTLPLALPEASSNTHWRHWPEGGTL